VRAEDRPASRRVRVVRRREHLARGLLWAAAGVTLLLLSVIIGYILYRGLFSNLLREEPVLPASSRSFSLDPEGRWQVAVVAHRGVRLRTLAVSDLVRLLDGSLRDWDLSQQDLKVRVFCPSPDTPLGREISRRLLALGPGPAEATVYASDDQDLLAGVSATPGAVGLIAAQSTAEVTGVRVLAVRSLSLVANSKVLEAEEDRQLRHLKAGDLPGLFGGQLGNWRELGGGELPVRPVVFASGHPLELAFRQQLPAGKVSGQAVLTLTVGSLEELAEVLGSTPGAVGYCPYLDARRLASGQILRVQHREVGRNLRLSYILESPARAGKAGGVSSIIVNTLLLILLTLLFSTPVGVLAALYLAEYARQGRLVVVLRFATETLSSIPSIIFGLFGYILFVGALKLGIGLLSGTLTVTIMVLPTIIRTAEEAFKAVPFSYREGSLSLGATKWQTITRVVLPAASPGVLTGVILAIGRTVGETAALLLTLGTNYRLAQGLSSSARVLSVHLYILVKEGISFERAFATGTILIAIVLLVNFATTRVIRRVYGN